MGRRAAFGVAGVLLVAGLATSGALAASGHLPGVIPVAEPEAAGPTVELRPSASPSGAVDPTTAAARALLAPPAPPATLVIPALGIRAVVESVGVDGQGRMAVPSRPDHVAWFKPGSAPGEAGDAVIDGHLDWTNGPAVFYHLGRLKAGDEVTVERTDGSQVKFIVDSTRTVPFDSPMEAMFTRTGAPTLSLVTCTGSWDRQRGTYLDRLVVHATLAPTPPQDRPGDEGG